MKRDARVYVEDVLESIGKIVEYSENTSKESFLDNSQLQDAIIRRSERIYIN